jgi:hypothetical protein
MPIHGEGVDVGCVLLLNFAKKSQKQNGDQADDADGDVKSVKADERVVGGAEKVGANGQTLVVDEVMPLAAGLEKENGTQEQS